jgi:hypothetical protein
VRCRVITLGGTNINNVSQNGNGNGRTENNTTAFARELRRGII